MKILMTDLAICIIVFLTILSKLIFLVTCLSSAFACSGYGRNDYCYDRDGKYNVARAPCDFDAVGYAYRG